MFVAQAGGAQASESEPEETAPGIPPFLAQARNRAGDVTQIPPMYDADNSLMPMGDLNAVLPDTNPLASVGGLSMVGMPGGGAPMFQEPIPQPSAGFLMAQQSVFGGDAYVDHYLNRQHGPSSYPQHPGGY
jgi:hypothetical protein